jgi:hypothetical protein
MPETWTTARARLAHTVRYRPDDAEAIAESRRELKVARAEDYVKRLVDEAPALTAEQRDRLAVLLRGGGAA